MSTKNKREPNTDTYGAPNVTCATKDIAPSLTIRWVHFFKKFSIHLRLLPRIP